MIVYVESSAVLAWLLGESPEAGVRAAIEAADRVVTSSLTRLECARGLTRARLAGRISAVQETATLHLLDEAVLGWDVHALTERVLARARTPFPVEPVRTLDAMHLATLLVMRDALGPIALLSDDERVRTNADALGFTVLPPQPPTSS